MASPNSTSDIIEIPLTQGQVTKVDSKHADLIDLGWYTIRTKHTFYAVRNDPPTGKHRRHVRLHRVILSRMLGRELLPKEDVDHIDLDGLNNLEENLRLATRSQNAVNSGRRSHSKSPQKGIRQNRYGKWEARIGYNEKRIQIGIFDTQEQAFNAYCEKGRELFGEFWNSGAENRMTLNKTETPRSERRSRRGVSGYRGVTFSKGKKKPWHATIKIDRKPVHIGYFDDPYQAHLAFLAAEEKYFGSTS